MSEGSKRFAWVALIALVVGIGFGILAQWMNRTSDSNTPGQPKTAYLLTGTVSSISLPQITVRYLKTIPLSNGKTSSAYDDVAVIMSSGTRVTRPGPASANGPEVVYDPNLIKVGDTVTVTTYTPVTGVEITDSTRILVTPK